ncbi:protein of unknown function [Methylocaldum szegediense]|uniref:Uncharacterized protein n=1 Tax=Methylocaldum szegediense TaxID=73780 RepID=A0ABM9I960_9GAMM|nr:protein of unknown function [Methylocaldum szegediense]
MSCYYPCKVPATVTPGLITGSGLKLTEEMSEAWGIAGNSRLNNREWIETFSALGASVLLASNSRLNNREWIETRPP